jgi:hypothetical protein
MAEGPGWEEDAMPANGSPGQGRIPGWAYTVDDPWLGYMRDFYESPGYVDYPEECDEGVKEDRVARRRARYFPAQAPASSNARPALSRLLLDLVARFRGARPERATRSAVGGQELSLGADRP